MNAKVCIWAYNDVTGKSHVIEKELLVQEWIDIQEATKNLIIQLNEENSIVLYYLLSEFEIENNMKKQWPLSWFKRIIDKWDSL